MNSTTPPAPGYGRSQTRSDKALASKLAAQASADEAHQAAIDASNIYYQKLGDKSAASEGESKTAAVDDLGRVSFIDTVLQKDFVPVKVKDNSVRCTAAQQGNYGPPTRQPGQDPQLYPWYKNDAGELVCNFKATIHVTGTVEYWLRTCPEPNLTIAQCRGKYSDWIPLLIATEKMKTGDQEGADIETTYQVKWSDWKKNHTTQGIVQQIAEGWKDGIVKCFTSDFWSVDLDCASSIAMVLPVGEMATAGKAILTYRVALETGIDTASATAAVEASLSKYGLDTIARFEAANKAMADLRKAIANGQSTDAAMNTLKSIRDVDPALVKQAEAETNAAKWAETCERNSFPAGTPIVLADGTLRSIEQVRIGDQVLTSDLTQGRKNLPQTVTATFTHRTQQLAEIRLAGGGSLTTTVGHRLYVEGAGWKLASTLKSGDNLRTPDGSLQGVTAVEVRSAFGATVYDLTVNGTHTFYTGAVGADGTAVLVHNCINFVEDDVKYPAEKGGGGHTVVDHIDLSGPTLLDAVKKKGLVTVWADEATAQKAMEFAVAEWRKAPANERVLQNWIKNQQKKTFFNPEDDLKEIPWEIPVDVIPGDLAYQYRLSGLPLPANPMAKTATSRIVVVQLKYLARHPDNFIVYTAFPI
ncbi:polymorphic toxin-type HINT domain-containing protein [Kitasatospora cineracea]|uniref:polymorphic toxin-type HINT domain-containing protein n=1 Tax=Kitasatospora cineracea TaxID=88074 RepID=UPI0036D7E1A6